MEDFTISNLINIRVLSLGFSFGVVGGNPDVFSRLEGRNFEVGQDRSNGRQVARPFEAVDGGSQVCGRDDEVDVKVAVGIEVQSCRATLRARPEGLSAAGELF